MKSEREGMRRYIKQVAVAFDQLLNALIGGWADETFSARCWRMRGHRVWGALRLIVDTALFCDRNHCEESYKSEVLRLQCPPALRPPEG
jgi:hypothetical protein